MDWTTIALLALIVLGVWAGIALAVREWLTNPARIVSLAHFLGKLLLPRVLQYVLKRNTPEVEERMRQCIRSGGKWNNVKKRCE